MIFVEGTDCYNNDCDWWGGNLEGAQSYPVTLNLAGRLVYSAHDYGPHEYGQSWFNGSTSYSSLAALWTKFWAYLSLNGVAPVWVGEFGTTNNTSDISNSAAGSQGQWFQSLVTFLKTNSNISWTYWALNGEDAYGLLDSQYDSTPANAAKQQALASIQFSPGAAPSCSGIAAIPSGVTASATSSSQIVLVWRADATPTGCNVTYNVYGSETATFALTSTNLLAGGVSSPGYSAIGLAAGTTYYFVITALDSAGQSAGSGEVSASTPSSTVAAPNAPSNLSAIATSSSAINLSWQASSTSGVTYNIYRSQTGGFTPSSATRIATGVNATSYTNSGLSAATTYYFLVTAVGDGESGPSNQGSATTQPIASQGAACHVVYTVNSQWNVGFNVGVTIQNTGAAAINSWVLSWTWPGNQSISQAWNSNVVSAGPKVALSNASWNASIAPGASVTGLGFNGTYSGTNPTPAAFYLNGSLCR